jgi:hypothetical protein
MTLEVVMKSKAKPVKRARKPVPKKAVRRGSAPAKSAQPKDGLTKQQKEILKKVWPKISGSTKIVQLPAGQSMVIYVAPSGDMTTATLVWFTFTHGPRVFGHYDDAGDVCYVGEIIE